MLVQFGNNWIQKIPLTAKLGSAYGLVQFWLSSEFFSSNYFQIGQHIVLLHILISLFSLALFSLSKGLPGIDRGNAPFQTLVRGLSKLNINLQI